MAKYDGWILKPPKGYLHELKFRRTRKEVMQAIEEQILSLPSNLRTLNSWRKYRRKGWKIVKVKLVEVNDG